MPNSWFLAGRPFYGCAKAMEASCGFFLWADEGNQPPGNQTISKYDSGTNTRTNTNTGNWPSRPGGSSDGAGVRCRCGLDAIS
jgi:hypothetical protein